MSLLHLGIICGPAVPPVQFTRFLDQFGQLADAISIVFAFGADPAPELLEIAYEHPKVRKLSTYDNKPEHRDWPHVDDFSAARNAAFTLAAEGDPEWIMWADTDDTITPEACAAIRDMLATRGADFDMVQLPYRIPYQSVTLWRERIIRPGVGKWTSPVHEHIIPVGDKPWRVVRFERGTITHSPETEKDNDGGRNLRILRAIPEDQLTTSHRYHIGQECLACGEIEEAKRHAMEFIGDPSAPDPEVYDTALSVAQLCGSAEEAAVFRTLALMRCPQRREAYYELALGAMKQGRASAALAWVRAADAQPMITGPDAPWNLRRKLYGWAGVHLRCMIERTNGLGALGDAREYNHLRKHGARISLIHATRGRPEKAAAARTMWLDRAADPDRIEHIFCLDDDDSTGEHLLQFRAITVPPGGGPVRAWNAGAATSIGDVLLQMSDDWEPPQDWDAQILAAIGDTSKASVLAISDGSRGDGLLCMAICTRTYFREVLGGAFFHPAFFSMFSDNWFTLQAEQTRSIIRAPQIVIRHLHPMLGHGEMDAIYARSNDLLHYAMGRRTFRQLSSGHPARSWNEIDGWGSFADTTVEAFTRIQPGGTYVEVGVAFGRNLSLAGTLAQFLNSTPRFSGDDDNIMVFGIDTFEGDEDCRSHGGLSCEQMEAKCRDNLTAVGVLPDVTILRDESSHAAMGFESAGLDVVFLDAAHDFASVLADLAAWWPKVKPGGILYGHDYDHQPVKDALAEWSRDIPGITIAQRGECWWIEKPVAQ